MKPPIPEQTIHKFIDLNLTWFVKQLKKEQEGGASAGVAAQFAINRDTAKTPRRNQEIEQALLFVKQTADWMYKVETFFTKRVEETILKQHNPVTVAETSSSSTTTTTATMAPGTICRLQNITKEPRFNGKQVVIKEYIDSQQRYRVEPLLASDGLPTSLLVKGKDLAEDTSAGNASSVQSITVDAIFIPAQPLLEDGATVVGDDMDKLLAAHDKALDDLLAIQARVYPPQQVPKMLSLTEATIVVVCRHVQRIMVHYQDGVAYLEKLLYRQLEAAIGKRVTPADFTDFMRHHGRRLLGGGGYAPQPFSYAIRRPNHAPDGMLSIENSSSPGSLPIDTMVRHVRPTAPLEIPLSAATTVPLTGEWYLHGWLMHQFGNETPTNMSFNLCARARQFSSFLLVIGTMTGATQLEPKHAIILQNKDDLIIPLLTEVLPSAKDFKDAIASLSPEQQDFCKAFRSMQLQSSVFGVAVIQLKPQLENEKEKTIANEEQKADYREANRWGAMSSEVEDAPFMDADYFEDHLKPMGPAEEYVPTSRNKKMGHTAKR
eukprot:scaffold1769_cov185-Amphora_coffeaeformis.AAC.6